MIKVILNANLSARRFSSAKKICGWFIIIAITLPALSAYPQDTGEDHCDHLRWRKDTNGGINCLFLYVKYLGYGKSYCSYYQSLSIENHNNATALKSIARPLGFDLDLRRVNYSELRELEGPTVVFLEPGGIGTGYFVNYIGEVDGNTRVFSGSHAGFRDLPTDDFKRHWVGLALVEQEPKRTNGWLLLGACMILSAPVVVVLFIRKGKAK